jgi:hypothetical protein
MSKLPIPADVLTQHIAVLGKTGSGKTSTAKLAIEQVVAKGARVCVLDPIKSDWWGLTSSANGKHAGLPFHILGGPHGHVPLHSAAGKAIADVVATGALPLSIIDMADFEPGGQAKFFVDFAPALLRKMRGVVYLVIEEAHLFAPKERSGIGAENLSIHWAKTMATAGRSKGVRLVLVTQRTQALHNALLGSCDTLIAHRLTAPADQDPVVKWLKANTSKDILEQVSTSLASLKTGEGWICSGEAKLFERVHFPRIATYDNTATPTGEGETREIKTAAVDPEKLRTIIGEAVDRAKADDPRELRRQIAELKKELSNSKLIIPNSKLAAPKVVEKFVLKDGQLARLEKIYERMFAKSDEYTQAMSALWTKHAEEAKAILRVLRVVTVTPPVPPATVHQFAGRREEPTSHAPTLPSTPAAPRGTGKPRPAIPSNGDATVGNSGLRRMLIALAQRPQGLTRRQLGLRAGLSSRSGTFDTYLSRARTQGWVDGTATVRITDAGREALGSYEPLPEGRELLGYWLGELGNSGAARILRELAAVYPRSLTRAELGEAANLSDRSGTFDTYLSRLRGLELVEGRSELRATEELCQ